MAEGELYESGKDIYVIYDLVCTMCELPINQHIGYFMGSALSAWYSKFCETVQPAAKPQGLIMAPRRRARL